MNLEEQIANPLFDYDYFLTKDNIFFIVKGYYHGSTHVRALPVYTPTLDGDRFHPKLGIRFKKVLNEYDNSFIKKLHPEYVKEEFGDEIVKVPFNEIKKVYRPREKFKNDFRRLRNTFWGDFYSLLNEICKISLDDIGIYGSYLIGLSQIKPGDPEFELDTVIYGTENIKRLKRGFFKVLEKLNRFSIDNSVINRVFARYQKQGLISYSNFSKIIPRYWPTVKISDNVSMTIRMVYKPNQIPENPIKGKAIKTTEIKGRVTVDKDVGFCPARFVLKTPKKSLTIATYLFIYQYAVRKGDIVKVKGHLRQDFKIITIDNRTHGIKILN